ncbi:uncharacterized protein RHIMIDRAFT_11003 [Rhizopus microsporus ATCC 52813]|uniref:F-box domain-containing protein n=1 Tax=Rhizopus microsporus ATCC 52813 TaxID=1340429 RepID=A0A2G4T9L1_RHIZD|nr:uncharacterized protein RHIMIDRAFT_11003 [Rhizopus microsporus ATCC 52813]PHZ17695.1 hypothetical protein RHIMIDRAFT_11003 [Rhizopus microsporus ATCC 52813]
MERVLQLEQLPVDILIQIFNYLDQPSRLQVCLVSKFMLKTCICIMCNNLYPYSSYMSGLNLSFDQADHIDVCCNTTLSLRTLWIENVESISPTFLNQIVRDVAELGLSKCSKETIRSVSVTLAQYKQRSKLEQIDIYDCYMSDQMVRQMVISTPMLKRFNYYRSGFLSDSSIFAIVEHCQLIESLIMTLPRHIVQANTVTFAALEVLAQLPGLKIFVCRGQVRIATKQNEEWMYKHCSSLIHCDLSFDT